MPEPAEQHEGALKPMAEKATIRPQEVFVALPFGEIPAEYNDINFQRARAIGIDHILRTLMVAVTGHQVPGNDRKGMFPFG